MYFLITIKSCAPMISTLKAHNLLVCVKIGDQTTKTAPFKGKARTATWEHNFYAAAKESFLKVQVWEDGFFGDTLHGDCIINLSKFYSTPGVTHTENVTITKDFKPIAQVVMTIQCVREASQTQPVPVQPTPILSMQQVQSNQPKQRELTPAKQYGAPEMAKVVSNAPKAPEQLYDLPVPYNSNTRTTRMVSQQPLQKYQMQYPEPAKGSFLNTDARMRAQQANQYQHNGYGRANTMNDNWYQDAPVLPYGYSEPNIMQAQKDSAHNGPVDPSVLIRLLAGQGPNIPQVSEVPVYQPNNTRQQQYQEYGPMAWM